jgi:hypothetical protein
MSCLIVADYLTIWPLYLKPKFVESVERKVRFSALFTNLVWWHTGTVSFPLSDVILAQLACPLSDVMFCLHSGINYISTNIAKALPKQSIL